MPAGRVVTASPPDRGLLGLAFGCGAYAALAAQDAAVKWLVVELPVAQVLFCRSVVIVAVCLALGRRALALQVVASPLRWALLVRGIVALAAWLCYFHAAPALPLGQLVTLWFAAPMFVVLLAVILLGESVGPARWAAVALGFAGTVAASDLHGASIGLAAVLALAGALLWALGIVLSRVIARREGSLVQMLASNVVFLLVTGGMSAAQWRAPTADQIWLCLLVGLLAGVGQLGLFEAIRRAPASLLAPVEYSALLWAFLLGYMVWGDVPAGNVLLGAALVAAAGMTVLVDQWVRLRPNAVLACRSAGYRAGLTIFRPGCSGSGSDDG